MTVTDIKTQRVRGDWRNVAVSINRAIRPTASLILCGVTYRVRNEARGGQEDRDYAVLRSLARDKHCILDVGANIGRTALVMAGSPMAEDGQIYAFEASEAACHLISENAALNGLAQRITVINALVAERSGSTIDFYGEAASGGASVIPGYLAHHRPMRKVTLALDDYVFDKGCSPDLIKIDVEGAEIQVLAGLSRTMREFQPITFIELHSWEGTTVVNQADRALSLLQPLNYCLIYLRTRTMIVDPTVLAGRGRCHVIACPNGSPFLNQLADIDTTRL